jgi:hypothetical protein
MAAVERNITHEAELVAGDVVTIRSGVIELAVISNPCLVRVSGMAHATRVCHRGASQELCHLGEISSGC